MTSSAMRQFLTFLPLLCAFSCSTGPSEALGPKRIQFSVPQGKARTWIGPEWFGNRTQDWRLRNGRIECRRSHVNKPLRVLHLLTASAGPADGSYSCSVAFGAQSERKLRPDAFGGILIGCGSADIDYRLSALAHSRPARDGGLACGVDGDGRLAFHDFETNIAKGGWGIGGRLRKGEFERLPSESILAGRLTRAELMHARLRVRVEPKDGLYDVILEVSELRTGRLLAAERLRRVEPRLVDGQFGLISHLGPKGPDEGYWFRDLILEGDKLREHPERRFGPIYGVLYTLSGGVLKLSAQMAAIGKNDPQIAVLELFKENRWQIAGRAVLEPDSDTFLFRLENWRRRDDVRYRVRYAYDSYEGVLRHDPKEKDVFVLGALTCMKNFTGNIQWNHNSVWFPHRDVVEALQAHDPDLLYFSGDQIYEGDITGAQRAPIEDAMLDYLDKWYRWIWSFRDVTRDRPTICIPDDHDVYHGNLWGAGGRHARRQDDGGYRMPPRFVKMVERTQTSHLPDPYDPTPVAQGIGVYYTKLDYGGISFGIFEDRKFKSSPTVAVPAGKFVNGWSRMPGFDAAKDADVPGAVLLGQRQLDFLEAWSRDWANGIWMKVGLSQTALANVATIPEGAAGGSVLPSLPTPKRGEYPAGYKKAADADSGGWPQTGRNKALAKLRKAFAMHVSGDQHLSFFLHYGIDAWNDAGYCFSTPAIGNTWPRRWFPSEGGLDREPGAPKYTGKFLDGFGNRMTVMAVANPVKTGHEPAALHDRVPGYGIVRFHKRDRRIVVESWPRYAYPGKKGTAQYAGWPITIRQQDNYGRKHFGLLGAFEVRGMSSPVYQVFNEKTGEHVYTIRPAGKVFRPFVFEDGRYTVWYGEPGTRRWKALEGLRPVGREPAHRILEF